MPSEPPTGSSRRRHRAPPTGYSRIPARSVSRMKATTARPVNAPITSASTRNTWSSRCCSLGHEDTTAGFSTNFRSSSGRFHSSLGNVPEEHTSLDCLWMAEARVAGAMRTRGRRHTRRFNPGRLGCSRIVGNPEVIHPPKGIAGTITKKVPDYCRNIAWLLKKSVFLRSDQNLVTRNVYAVRDRRL